VKKRKGYGGGGGGRIKNVSAEKNKLEKKLKTAQIE